MTDPYEGSLHMSGILCKRSLAVALLLLLGCETVPSERIVGKGMTDANKERLVLDDMTDVSDWVNGSPEETQVSSSDKHVKDGSAALLFANVVDHTKGEKNYPVGWPRTSKDLVKAGLSDWSGYDFFECWIYTETSRDSLPTVPLGVGFSHAGHKQSSSFELRQARKNEWAKVLIPISKITAPKDVRGIQFHISESNYKHRETVDFYISGMALTRFVEPAIADFRMDKKVIYANDPQVTAIYSLVGHKGMEQTTADVQIGRGVSASVAQASGQAALQGELPVVLPPERMIPGTYWARLSLRSADGQLLDQKQAEFRVLRGPF